MFRNKSKKKRNIIQAIGLGFLALLLTFTSAPEEAQAFNIFNGNGNDGYFLSLTNDPSRNRIVPVVIYDQHAKRQTAKAFLEWKDVEVFYANFDTSKAFPNGSTMIEVDDMDGDAVVVNKLKRGGKVKFDSSKAYYPEMFGAWAQKQTKTKDFKKDSALAWTFPAFAGNKRAADYTATQDDLDRAVWVTETLVQDFNSALNLVHQASVRYGTAREQLSDNDFVALNLQVAEKARSAVRTGKAQTLKHKGVTFSFTKGIDGSSNRNVQNGVKADAYVTIKATKDSKGNSIKSAQGSFVENVPKGYVNLKGKPEYQPMYHKLPPEFQTLAKKDVKTLDWKLVALQSNSNWGLNGVTFTTINRINKMSKLEEAITDFSSSALTHLRQMLGLFNTSELIMNEGQRGTDLYYKGIMPMSWMNSANILHWVSYAVAWMLIIGAVAKLLIQRNLAAINPSARVDLIDGIKNLMIVGFALSIYDLLFAGAAEMNFLFVEMLGSTGVGVETFGAASVGSGFFASVIVGAAYLVIDIYFNFFYIARALMVAILYAVGPLYIASIAFGEKYRQIFGNYIKEMVGNLFVQSFQAILVVFFVGISIMGSLRNIETLVLLFCFIPMTKFFKESVGASSSASEALTGSALGATAGVATGLIGAQFMNKNKDRGKSGGNNVSSSSNDISMKSGSFNAQGGGVGGSGGGGSMIKQDTGSRLTSAASGIASGAFKATAGATKATVGAGLIAGGAATGMKGASQLGGFMVGGGVADIGKAGKDIGLSKEGWAGQTVEKAKEGAIGFFGGNDMKDLRHSGAVDRHGIGTGSGQPTPEHIQTMADGSSVQTFNKSDFSQQTGIVGMNDYDNLGNEMEIQTGYVSGKGFTGGHAHLNGTEYGNRMGDMVNAFESNDQTAMAKYEKQGIIGVNNDRNTGRTSFIVNKDQMGIGGVNQSGDHISIQRNNPSTNRPRTNSEGHANPFANLNHN